MSEISRLRKTLWRQGKPFQKRKGSIISADRGTIKSHLICSERVKRLGQCHWPLQSLLSEKSFIGRKRSVDYYLGSERSQVLSVPHFFFFFIKKSN